MFAAQGGHEQVYTSTALMDVSNVFTPHFSHHIDQVARALLENGAAVNSQNNNGFSALMLSAQNGHEQV